jgi:hypothetical protein
MDITALTDAHRVLGTPQPTLLILGRPTCDDCQAFYAELADWTSSRPVEVLTLNLRAAEGEAFRSANAWTSAIDFVPFNVLYVNGEPVDQWTGGDLQRVEHALAALEE